MRWRISKTYKPSTETSFLTQEAGFFSSFQLNTTLQGALMKEKSEANEHAQETEQVKKECAVRKEKKRNKEKSDDIGSDIGYRLQGW